MSKAHYIAPTVPQSETMTVRLGASNGHFNQNDLNKFVKLAAESEYDLCAAGDPIEAIVNSVDTATASGQTVGGIYDEGVMFATADGLQATPGTGTLAVGDYVVCGTVVAKNTLLTGFARVCKATVQPGAAVVSGLAGADTAAAVKVVLDAALVKVAQAELNALFAWRVKSLGSGAGAVGTTVVLERENY